MIFNHIRKIKKLLTGGVVRLRCRGRSKGAVLLSYITAPFLLDKEIASHSNHWECKKMVEIFLDAGYDVDVINWDNKKFIPKKDYSFVVDIHGNLERWASFLKKNCVKILHATGSHWLFQNNAEYERLLALKNRRGIVLFPRRAVPPSRGIENADMATLLGNEVTAETFKYAGKSIYKMPVASPVVFESPARKDFSVCAKNFIWLGGSGLVHKGLDRVLEAFARMPEYKLTVCGSVENESDFKKAFHKELSETENIKTVGWVDLLSEQFKKIADGSAALIYPSCSEGQAGSVVACVAAGLIPVVSRESGVDVDDFGFVLRDSSVEEIMEKTRLVANLSAEELRTRAMGAWQYAREHHSREKFEREYGNFVRNILKA